jgi:hypothetical protein
LTSSGDPVPLALTPGKDSRLVLAATLAAGVHVRTSTRGLADHPDVVVARRLAELAGVPHERTMPAGSKRETDQAVTVDPLDLLRRAVVHCDGMLSAYNATGPTPGPYRTSMGLNGAGGEILRGGFAKAVLPSATRRAAEFRLADDILLRRPELLRADVRQAYAQDVQGWIEAADADLPQTLDDFYVRQRAGRWTAAARSGQSLVAVTRSIMLDHTVVRIARATRLDVRVDERLIAAALRQLAPTLAAVPFANKRWLFEEHGPADPSQAQSWHERAPVTGGGRGPSTFNWRHDYGPELAVFFQDLLRRDDAWSALVDPASAAELLSRVQTRTVWQAQDTWRLATVAATLSGRWHNPDGERFARSGHLIAVSVPRQNIPATTPVRARPTQQQVTSRIWARVRRHPRVRRLSRTLVGQSLRAFRAKRRAPHPGTRF